MVQLQTDTAPLSISFTGFKAEKVQRHNSGNGHPQKNRQTSDSEFSKLYQEEQQLGERLETLKSQNKTSAETQAKIDKIMDMIENEKFELETFDNVLIRKLIECVKVLGKSEILVIFKGGYEVKTDIE